MGEKDVKKEGRRRRRKLIVDERSQLISAHRKLRKIGDSYYISIPREFVERHGLKEGDILPLIGDHLMMVVPIQKEVEKSVSKTEED